MAEPAVMGGAYDWNATIKNNSVAQPRTFAVMDLTSATVVITFTSPSGIVKQYAATILVAINGTCHLLNPVATFDEEGNWTRSWRVTTLAGVVLESAPKQFYVADSNASKA